MKRFSRLFAVVAAAISLSACVGAAVVPGPVASTGATMYVYPDGHSYPYPTSVYYETYRLPR